MDKSDDTPAFDPSTLATMFTPNPAAMQQMFFPLLGSPQAGGVAAIDPARWGENMQKLQEVWTAYQRETALSQTPPPFLDPTQWSSFFEGWYRSMPFTHPDVQQELWNEGMRVWQSVMSLYGQTGLESAQVNADALPRKDRRFADPKWREQPVFALIHQTYLMLAERLEAMVDQIDGLSEDKREQLRFSTRTALEALSPANFAMTNPLVIERTMATSGENLVKGAEHMLADLRKGQLTHTDADAFTLGENIAITPGKVVHQTDMLQLIQYTPTTDKVLETPLVIFPPWINRYYILDLNPQKSFIRWAVEQGITVFVASWKSADASMVDVVWDDYIQAEIDAVDFIRDRLDVPSVHAIGYCVAGTTLAAALAILARRKEADKVRSATFFTAQVDFEEGGDLKAFIAEGPLAMVDQASGPGYLDGRFMAATFNMLRSTDLIWNYVVNNYMMGEDYPAFDLLHWNGDTTNLPAKWHGSYLRDLYRDNRLVLPDEMSACGTPIDLTRVKTPSYIQAGREDHIAPAASVFKMTRHFDGPTRFVLAGSGHIAGVVNPPDAKKYQYWTNEAEVSSLAEFREGAIEHPGSWWPDWLSWLTAQGSETVAAKGKRVPGSKGDKVIEDAPGTYVRTR
ncbi:PHA/PHB synthase family protein [Altererythrobacter sp. CAU 1778]